jgi:hypothetical protein
MYFTCISGVEKPLAVPPTSVTGRIQNEWVTAKCSRMKGTDMHCDHTTYAAMHLQPKYGLQMGHGYYVSGRWAGVLASAIFFAGKRGTLLSRRGYKAIMVQILKNCFRSRTQPKICKTMANPNLRSFHFNKDTPTTMAS